MTTHTIKFDKSFKKWMISGILLLTGVGYVDLRNTRCDCRQQPAGTKDPRQNRMKPAPVNEAPFQRFSPAQSHRTESE